MKIKLFMLFSLLCAFMQGAWATGELPGVFSVSSTKQVWFSQGNLQAVCTSADNGGSTQESWTWSFATNQYDYVGNAAANNAINGNGSVSSAGTVDLFGWSTAATYYGIHICNENASEYSGDFVDWGNLAISNGGNTANSGWRTLTRDEWAYLFANHTYGYATVAGVKGIIIVPDGYAGSAINSNHDDDTNPFARNTIDADTWTSTYAPAGVVFLPAAGFRLSWIGQQQENAYYWSSTPVDGTNKYATLVGKPSNDAIITYSAGGNWPANDGFSVRLVKDVPTYTASFATGSIGPGWSIDPTSTTAGTTVTVSYSGVHKVKSVTVGAKPICMLVDATSEHVGKIIGADGYVYNTIEQANTVTTASAVIAYVGKAGSVDASSNSYRGIAISLENISEGGIPFCTHSGGWFAYKCTNLADAINMTDPNTKEGINHTMSLALANSAGADHDNGGLDGTQGHLACKAVWKYNKAQPVGVSHWFMPTIAQWNLIVKGLMNRNTDIQTSEEAAIDCYILSAKITPSGAEGFPTGANYWTCMESDADHVWCFRTFYLGSFAQTMEKTSTAYWTRIRAAFAF